MSAPTLTKQLVAPVGAAVIGVTALAWYVSIATSDSPMMFTMSTPDLFGSPDFPVFFALMATMMVAMMLPATLPMVVGYRSLLKGRSSATEGIGPNVGTLVFLSPYVLVWGAFGVGSVLLLSLLGLMGNFRGILALVPGAILVGTGVYQFTSVKAACLKQCQSPFTFVLGRWKKGLRGAFRMGLSHSKFCVGCCWLFMVALFVTGAMSLLWMGGVSIMIFIEKVGIQGKKVSAMIGALLVVLGLVLIVPVLATA